MQVMKEEIEIAVPPSSPEMSQKPLQPFPTPSKQQGENKLNTTTPSRTTPPNKHMDSGGY